MDLGKDRDRSLNVEKGMLKSGKDTKGMISYKDLRNLLRSTKEYKYD